MQKLISSGCVVLLLGLIVAESAAGPKGTVSAKQFANGAITIDGDFSDWNLNQYTTPSQQPPFPAARDNDSTNANGDHLIWELDRVGPFNGTDLDAYDPAPSDFGSAIYLGYDTEFLYLLGVFIDDEFQGDRDDSGFSNFLNDGYEIFIDALGDSDDQADEIAFPAFDEEEPNLDDFQMTFALNSLAPHNNPTGPNDLGARHHMERAGSFEVLKEAYEDILQDIPGPSTAARQYADLRAAGARNPELAASPDETFTGYAIEARVPFGIVDGFSPDHDMGFALFWRDVDDAELPDAGFGGGNIFWTDWTQNTEVQSTFDGLGLFHTSNWGTLTFEGATAQLQPGDADEDLDFDQFDLIKVQVAAKYLSGDAATWGEGDWDGAPGGAVGSPPTGDGLFNQRDIIAALGAGTYLTGPYAALQPAGIEADGQTSVSYNPMTGEVAVDAPTGLELTSVNIDSAGGIFTGEAAMNLGGSFDNDADGNIFKATFGGSFGSMTFGNVAQTGLSEEFLLGDLTVVGSLSGGGDLGNVDLIYIPEPATGVLVLLALLGLVGRGTRLPAGSSLFATP